MERDLPDKLVQNGNRWDEAEAPTLAFEQEFMARELIAQQLFERYQGPVPIRIFRSISSLRSKASEYEI
jgi:hypothetical protein